MNIYFDILFNLGTVTTFGIVSSLLEGNNKKSLLRQLYHGLVFGTGAMIGMLHPVVIKPGLIFDGRSVLISLAGLFFGPIAAGISGLMALLLRITQGGPGMYMGIAVITSSAFIGIIFYYQRPFRVYEISVKQLFYFGLLVHLVMLLCTFALPPNIRVSTLKTMIVPILTIYPLATVVLGKILSLIMSRSRALFALKVSEEKLKELNDLLEERVLERTKELEKANQALESFSYSVSHDLRAPLRAIEGFSTILKEEYSPVLDKQGVRYLSIIASSVARMNQLINGLLTVFRVTKSELKVGLLDMNKMVDQLIKEAKSRSETPEKISISHDLLFDGVGDKVLIEQVWTNLLENAVKFSSKKEASIIHISSYREGGLVVYVVKDNGCGFNQQYAKKLFTVFQRLHAPDDFEGTGIGLAMIERIIQRHSGKVWAEGIEGEGATFYFSLPMDKQEENHGR